MAGSWVVASLDRLGFDPLQLAAMSWEILEGDCVEQMRSMPEASVDAVVCDPPYGLGFMGKVWDSPGSKPTMFERKAARSNTELDRQSGEQVSGANPTRRGADGERTAYGEFAGQDEAFAPRGIDRGGASRFFPTFRYEPKASRAERNAGLAGFEERAASKWGSIQEFSSNPPRANVHPTVKPIDLMRWLVRLVTPPGGTVLDPFTGSGSTGCAAILEGFEFVGIEREAEYIAIARARIEAFASLPAGTDTDVAVDAIERDAEIAASGQASLLEEAT
jgi:DNA modification methylase